LSEIAMILARADNGVIGRDGGLPWHIPADMRRFKALTMGCPMIMGRTTFLSFPRPLPGRRHIVLTRDGGWRGDSAEPVHDVQSALALAAPAPLIWIIGGAQIYCLFEPLAQRIELTQVHAEVIGDTVMPAFDPAIWRENSRQDFAASEDGPAHSFVTLRRIK
jgi:dihydrofolate reductase